GRLEKQMKMVGQQAVAEERERVPCLGAGEIAKEHIPFALGAEDIGSVVPAVDRVVNMVIACRSWKSSHDPTYRLHSREAIMMNRHRIVPFDAREAIMMN